VDQLRTGTPRHPTTTKDPRLCFIVVFHGRERAPQICGYAESRFLTIRLPAERPAGLSESVGQAACGSHSTKSKPCRRHQVCAFPLQYIRPKSRRRPALASQKLTAPPFQYRTHRRSFITSPAPTCLLRPCPDPRASVEPQCRRSTSPS
jgi:hypothetical protein